MSRRLLKLNVEFDRVSIQNIYLCQLRFCDIASLTSPSPLKKMNMSMNGGRKGLANGSHPTVSLQDFQPLKSLRGMIDLDSEILHSIGLLCASLYRLNLDLQLFAFSTRSQAFVREMPSIFVAVAKLSVAVVCPMFASVSVSLSIFNHAGPCFTNSFYNHLFCSLGLVTWDVQCKNFIFSCGTLARRV